MENYEHKYREAFERAKKLQKTCDSQAVIGWCEYIFPELAESEDERIRKELIELVRNHARLSISGKMVAWLEKQGEHANFRNKIQIGDKVTCNEDGVLVNLSQLERVAKPSEKQGKQNPSWSEEDEKMCQETIDWFEKKCFPYALENDNPAKESIKWLKSLKDRVQPQPKQEWSKEDENMRESVIDVLVNNTMSGSKGSEVYSEEIDWLKSLKHNHWKPSEEQMKAIKYFIDFHRPQANASTGGWNEFKHLESLYNNLKNL